jgi:hypothetical protein
MFDRIVAAQGQQARHVGLVSRNRPEMAQQPRHVGLLEGAAAVRAGSARRMTSRRPWRYLASADVTWVPGVVLLADGGLLAEHRAP